MIDQNTIMEGLNRQFKLIECTRKKWEDGVMRSGEVFTSLAYNLMRESLLNKSNISGDELWFLKLIPRCSAACKLFLAGDTISAAHVAAARQIEKDFDSLWDLLWGLQECIKSVEKAVHRLVALHKLRANSNAAAIVFTSPVSSPIRRKKKQRSGKKVEDKEDLLISQYLPWSTLDEEARALVHRLQEDIAFREGLVRALVPTTANAVAGNSGGTDGSSPQCLCFLWRKAHQIVEWENLLDLVQHIREVTTT